MSLYRIYQVENEISIKVIDVTNLSLEEINQEILSSEEVSSINDIRWLDIEAISSDHALRKAMKQVNFFSLGK